MKHRGLKFLSLLLTLVMVLGMLPGMGLTAYAASAVNVKIVTTLNSESPRTIAESTTLPQDYTVAALIPTMGWDQNSYDIQVNGTNAQIKSGSGKDMVITISDKGTFTIEVKYDYYGMMTITKNATVSVTELELVDVTGVTIKQGESAVSEITLDKDSTTALTAVVDPDNATDKKVKWSVGGTNASAVTLYSDATCQTPLALNTATDTLTAYAKGTAAGSATVTVTSNADATKSASCAVTVNAAGFTVTYAPGDGASLKDGIQPPDGYTVDGQNIVKTGVTGEYQIEGLESCFNAPEGKVFDCWKDANGTEYRAPQKVNLTANLTLTAQWKEEKKPDGGEKKTGGGSGFDLVFNIPGADNSWEYVGGYAPQQAYRVSLAPMQGGSAALGLTTGDSGTQMNVYPSTTVYVFPNAEQGYTLDKIVWSLIDGSASYDITEAKNFVMPAMDVVVYVTFKPVG